MKRPHPEERSGALAKDRVSKDARPSRSPLPSIDPRREVL
jgi:hypothetical protein